MQLFTQLRLSTLELCTFSGATLSIGSCLRNSFLQLGDLLFLTETMKTRKDKQVMHVALETIVS
eukprot:m.91284 g.91284  ORF g.91284 m.91284 type:complete len:64 (+) comp15033_c0_seq1:2340-2531(+)